MRLTDTAVKNLKFTGTAAKHTDGQGLYLLVNGVGKYWRFDYRFVNKRKTLALGIYPDVSLAKARKRRDAARELVADGKDPGEAKKQARAELKTKHANTFEGVAADWLTSTTDQRKAVTDRKLKTWMDTYVLPEIGKLPVSA